MQSACATPMNAADVSRRIEVKCRKKSTRRGYQKVLLHLSIFSILVRRDNRARIQMQSRLKPSSNTNLRRIMMRVMVIVKANKDSEAGVLPSRELLAEMGKFNEQLAKAGIMLAGEGLQASSKGKRVKFSGTKRTVIDGPFTESKELIAGFWLWQVRSMEEAVEWLKRAPFDGGEEVEIRQVFEAQDFGGELTPELREQDERIRQQIEKQKAS
jgi:hypothetical protein